MEALDSLIDIVQSQTAVIGNLIRAAQDDRDTIGEMAARLDVLERRLADHFENDARLHSVRA